MSMQIIAIPLQFLILMEMEYVVIKVMVRIQSVMITI